MPAGNVMVAWDASDDLSGLLNQWGVVDSGTASALMVTNGAIIALSSGQHTLTVLAEDRAGNAAQQEITFAVDNMPPNLDVSVSPNLLWPANHKMVAVHPIIQVSDNLDLHSVVKLVSVTSNEPDNGLGDGDTANDIVIQPDGTILLRAERSGKGNGRIYTITYSAQDAAGNITVKTITVLVPHNH